MKKIILVALSITLITISCSTKPKEEKPDTTEASTVENNKEDILIPSDSGIVRINLKDGKAFARIQKKQDKTIYIEFMSGDYKKVTAHLSSPDSLANIRFSQIFLPNGTMDGPFSRDIEYELPVSGLYKLSVHENMMAGDPWAGTFDVNIELKK